MDDIRKRYVNIDMCGRGCTSGKWEEWPVLREECRAVLDELEHYISAYANECGKAMHYQEMVEKLEVELACQK